MKKYIFIFLVFSIVVLSSCKEEPCNCTVEPYWILLDYHLETDVNELLVTKSNYILLATSTKGILISKDKWKTWNKAPGISDTNIYTLKQLDDGSIAAINWKNLYISNDEGQTWMKQNLIFPDTILRVTIANNGFLGFVGNNKTGNLFNYYISRDMGKNWETVPLSFLRGYNQKVNIEAQNDFIILSVREINNYTSTYIKKSGEISYNKVNTSYGEWDLNFKLWLLNGKIFIRCSNLICSNDMGNTWITKEKGIYGAISSSSGFNYTFNHEVMLMNPGNGIYYSTDFADSWVFLRETDNNSYRYFLTNDKYLIRDTGGIWFISKNPIF